MWRTPKLRSAAPLALGLVLAACGGGGAGGDGDPATAVPPDAALYAEFVVRPQGSLDADARAAAGKVLLSDDPGGELRGFVERGLDDLELDYERDVEPWLGPRAAVWVPGSRQNHDVAVLLLTATDTAEARSSLEAILQRSGETVTERSYRGSDYLAGDDGAAGIVGDFLTIGSEDAFKRTVDAFEDDSLAESDAYSEAIDGLEDERLAHFWVDTATVLNHALAADREARRLSALLPLDDLPPVAAAFAADGDALSMEARARARERLDLGSLLGGSSTPLLRELPGDSWLALGSADVGKSLRETIDRLAGAFGGIAVRSEVRRRTGLDLDRDLLDWIGHVGFFVRGTTPETLGGGVVIQPTDAQRAADAFGRIVGAIQVAAKVRARPVDVAGADQAFELVDARAPCPIVLARGSGLVVLTAGRPAAEAALGRDDRLGDADVYEEAEDLVGMEPAALLSMPHALELAAGHPDPGFQEARPYLEAFTVIAAGVTVDGDEGVARLAAGLD